METINGFGVEIKQSDGHVLFQCPKCNPESPYDLGDIKNIVHVIDTDNDGLADLKGIRWSCPNENCTVMVQVPYEESPQFEWGRQLKHIFANKKNIFNDISITFSGLNVSLVGTPHYLDDDFSLTSDASYDKKFKIVFAINELEQFDVWISTQLQDEVTDWGELPVGWTELDCILMGTIKIDASNINESDIISILDSDKITGLV